MATQVRARMPDPTRRRVEATTEAGLQVVMDGLPPDGEGSAPGPRETLLAALAGCTSMDVAAILAKKRQRPATYEVVVTADAAPDNPRVYTRIDVEHRVTGDVEPEALRRAVELSATRYCPVNAMLSGTVRIEHRYHLVGTDGVSAAASVAVIGPKESESAR